MIKLNVKVIFIFLVMVFAGSLVLLAENGMGRHKRMFAVPVGKDIKIDGKLDDWDLSGQIEMFAVSETKDMQNGKFAMMYDDEAIYLGGQVRDPSPMMNRHDPEVDGNRGWDADSFQFRMSLDPSLGYPVKFNTYKNGNRGSGKVAHLILWYYTDKKEPCMQMNLGMDYKAPRKEWEPHGVVPNKFYQAAYRKDDDGLGYSFEYRIPWSVFGMKKPYKANDLAAGTVQFNWSRPDGLKMTGMSGVCYDVLNKGGFPYQNTECWGKIVFCEKGNLPKELVEDGVEPELELPLKFSYDLPEDSEVTVELFNEKKEVVRLLVVQGKRLGGKVVECWDGLDDHGSLLPVGKYSWRGVYHQPIKTKYLFAVHNSGKPGHKTDDNTGGWGGDHGNPTTVCRAGKDLLLAWDCSESGWGIIKVNEKGRKLWGAAHDAVYLACDGKRFFTYGGHGFNQAPGVKIFDLKDGRPINWGNGHPYLVAPAGGSEETDKPTGLAYCNGVVYVSYGDRNLLARFNGKTGNLIDTLPVENPGRIAVEKDGNLLVISKDKILRIKNGKSSVIIDKGLDNPAGIAVDQKGTIYVSNCGKLQDISVFDSQGKYLKSIGKKGGRPRVGLYKNDGVLEPGGIAIDSTGRLWVAETLDFPKRISIWNTQTGKFVNEFFGGSSYFGWAYIDTEVPNEIYCHNVIWKINWKTNEWKPYSTIWRATRENMVAAPNPGGYNGHFRVITAKNERQYGFGRSSYGSILYMRVGDIFKPIAGVIRLVRPPGYAPTGQNYKIMWDDPKKYPNGIYWWQDRNDDQCVQADEISRPDQKNTAIFNWIDKDLNAWCDAGFILKPVKIEKDGRPVYDFSKREPIPFIGRNSNAASLYLDNKGGIYTLNPGKGKYDGFTKYNSKWEREWKYPNIKQWQSSLTLPPVTPGKLWGLTMPLGIAGDFTGAATYFNPYHIFTTDGIYVSMIMRDVRTGGLGPDVTASETITGQLVKPKGMNRYFLLAGDQDGRVTEVLGLDTVKRLKGGSYQLTEADAEKAKKAKADYEKALRKMQKLVIARTKSAINAAEAIDKKIDDKRGFSFKSAYDKDNLYIEYDVKSPFELVNSYSDPILLFKGGNCLDIQLATDSSAKPEREKPVAGDLRILVTRRNGKPFAIIYYPKIKGFKGQPTVFKSPTGQESFDKIETTDKIGLEYRKNKDGFKALVTIPLKLIGLSLKPNMKLQFDLGYIYGNNVGNKTAMRKYWNNNSFTANVLYDIPHESRLEPKEWGSAVVE
jgi:hypothetical protein